MARKSLVERKFTAFMRTPVSVRAAMGVIVTATLVSVVAGGIAITFLDHEEFPDIGTGLWWALQTVTTVGYGDVTPKDPVGRLVGAVIMLESIAFVAIITAAITSSFVERARREQASQPDSAEHQASDELVARLARVEDQLERIARTLDAGVDTSR